TAWNNAVRSRLYLTKPKADGDDEPESDARILRTMKANYGATGGAIKLRWAHGVLHRDEPSKGMVATIERRAVDAVFLDMIDKMAAENRPLSSSANATNFAPKVFAKRPDRSGYSMKDFRDAM